MQASRIKEWLQVVGGFGVLAGLILVALQIQQNTVLVRAELLSNAWDAWVEIDASKQGENFAGVLGKAIESPRDLTIAEMVELDGYLYTYLDQLGREHEMYDLGVFDDPWQGLIPISIHGYFGNQFAQSWWAETKWKFHPEIVEVIDREMESISTNQDIEYVGRIRARLSD